MQCQQTQKLETTLLLVSQDLQVRQGNPELPVCGKVGDTQTVQLKARIAGKGIGGQGRVISVLTGSLKDILGNVEKYILVPFQVCFSAHPHWDLFLFPCLLLLMERGWTPPCEHIGVLSQLLLTTLAPHCHFTSLSLDSPPHSPQHMLHRCQGNSISSILSVATPPTPHCLNHYPSCSWVHPYSLRTFSRGKQFMVS